MLTQRDVSALEKGPGCKYSSCYLDQSAMLMTPVALRLFPKYVCTAIANAQNDSQWLLIKNGPIITGRLDCKTQQIPSRGGGVCAWALRSIQIQCPLGGGGRGWGTRPRFPSARSGGSQEKAHFGLDFGPRPGTGPSPRPPGGGRSSQAWP